MRRPTCSDRSTTRVVPPEVLDALAEHLATSQGHDGGPPLLVRVRRGPDRSVDLSSTPLTTEPHPVDALLGRTVAASWWASGLVVCGRAWSGVDVHPHAGVARAAPGGSDEPRRVAVAVLVDRSGHVAHRVDGIDPIERPPAGRAVDLLRRTLGLPTHPPSEPAALWWRTLWLDGVVSAAALLPDDSGPASDVAGTLGVPLVRALVEDPALLAVDGWADLRRLAAEDAPTDPGRAAIREAVLAHLTPSQAAWMDDGCFARWMLAALPPAEELLELVDVLLPPDAAAAVHAAVGAPPPSSASSGCPAPGV